MRLLDTMKWGLPIVMLATALAILIHYVYFIFPLYSKKAEVLMIIEPGATVAQIASDLTRTEVIDNPALFKAIARTRGAERKMKAGRYKFEKGQSEAMTVAMLAKGSTVGERVTIPEGLTFRQIGSLLSREASVDSVRFVSLSTDEAFIKSLGVKAVNLEGYLFPDTYNIFWRMEAARVIRMMVGRLLEVFDETHQEKAIRMKSTLHRILTMASMVEREAMVSKERPLIAGVLYNRLRIGMALQCDATVQYALPKHKELLTYRDLEVKSAYNTYLHRGLPPGPICNPGADAIQAALCPEDTEYLYYVALGDGSHIFSRTKREHARAKVEARLNKQAMRRN